MSLLKLFSPRNVKSVVGYKGVRFMSQLGDLGSGAGKGGGDGGSIRSAGGAFGKLEAGREEEYFYKKQKDQIKKMKKAFHEEISFHEEQIQRHQEAIERSRSRIKNLIEEKQS